MLPDTAPILDEEDRTAPVEHKRPAAPTNYTEHCQAYFWDLADDQQDAERVPHWRQVEEPT